MKLKIIGLSFAILSLQAMQIAVPSLKQLSVTVAADRLIDQYQNDEDLIKEISKNSLNQEISELLVLEIVSYRSRKSGNERFNFIKSIFKIEKFESIYARLLDRIIAMRLTDKLIPESCSCDPYKMCATYCSNEKLLKILFEKYQLNPKTILRELISLNQHKHLEKVIKVTAYNINETKYNPKKRTILHDAVFETRVECVKELLRLGARNQEDINKSTPSHIARTLGYKKLAGYIENYTQPDQK